MLLYDADCGFCTRSATWAAPRIPGVEVAPMQTRDLPALGVDPYRATREVPYVGADGAVVYGSDAIATELTTAAQRRWRAVGRVLLSRPVRPPAHAVYRLVARNRHRLPGGAATCKLPPV